MMITMSSVHCVTIFDFFSISAEINTSMRNCVCNLLMKLMPNSKYRLSMYVQRYLDKFLPTSLS